MRLATDAALIMDVGARPQSIDDLRDIIDGNTKRWKFPKTFDPPPDSAATVATLDLGKPRYGPPSGRDAHGAWTEATTVPMGQSKDSSSSFARSKRGSAVIVASLMATAAAIAVGFFLMLGSDKSESCSAARYAELIGDARYLLKASRDSSLPDQRDLKRALEKLAAARRCNAAAGDAEVLENQIREAVRQAVSKEFQQIEISLNKKQTSEAKARIKKLKSYLKGVQGLSAIFSGVVKEYAPRFASAEKRIELIEKERVKKPPPKQDDKAEIAARKCHTVMGHEYDEKLPAGLPTRGENDAGTDFEAVVSACKDAVAMNPNDVVLLCHLTRARYQRFRDKVRKGEITDPEKIREESKSFRQAYGRLASRGSGFCTWILGNWQYRGLGGERDRKGALSSYEKAGSLGIRYAYISLGIMYYYNDIDGIGERTKAERFGKAYAAFYNARGKYGAAMAFLGKMHEEGQHVAKDPAAARSWYDKSVATGNSFGKLFLAQFLLKRGTNQGEALDHLVDIVRMKRGANSTMKVSALRLLSNHYSDRAASGKSEDIEQAYLWLSIFKHRYRKRMRWDEVKQLERFGARLPKARRKDIEDRAARWE